MLDEASITNVLVRLELERNALARYFFILMCGVYIHQLCTIAVDELVGSSMI
jgi:hypothetical protein